MAGELKKKIAIIGTGISGLGAASLLHPHHSLTLFEKNAYIGGHSRTIDILTPDGSVAVDTGFIVFNKKNYPLLTRLFDALQVPCAKSDMSFGVSINNGWLEYGTSQLRDFFAQKKNLFRPEFWGMIGDILKFNKYAPSYLEADPHITLGDCLDDLALGSWFRQYFLLAMGGAIWSTPLKEMLDFPAASFIRFFENHGLLTIKDHPQWWTVIGGSREYVRRLVDPFKHLIYLNRAAQKVWREESAVYIQDISGGKEAFDEVVFACHGDQALALISDPTPNEKKVLGSFRYQKNKAVLHSDISFMPKRRNAWASWVYLCDHVTDDYPSISLSYWMNNLQPLKTTLPLILTLNPSRAPDPALVHDHHLFEHPVFDAEAINAQRAIQTIQGTNRLWFCGAYQRYGFHEDGLESAVNMTQAMGVNPPW
ncbi:MAG: NAD(P)/FAD-dependent oxidoreductase [Alphaproteobacteria bacterium]|jgi:predicted NAD/FAD-binding protein